MKREHTTTQSYIDWLKSLGCLVYLPLSADGDLQDRISGLSLQLTGNGSLVWDNGQQMYKVTQPTSIYQCVANLNNGLDTQSFPNISYTTLHTIVKITNASNKNIKTMAPNSTTENTIDALCACFNGTSRTNQFPTGVANVAMTLNHTEGKRRFYQQGLLYGEYSEYGPYLPSNWVLNGTGLKIAQTYNTNTNSGTQYYMKEVYLFNTALDLATIRQIQGYE